jgi:hypothetical protein
MNLFSPHERTNCDSKIGSESSYEYWDRSARPLAEFMRLHAENWSQNFLLDSEFISKFKSKRDDHHDAAIFELLTNQTLLTADLEVVKLARSSSKMPDFQVMDKKTGQQVYIECTLSADSFDSRADKVRKDEILEVIEGLHYFPYFVNVEFGNISYKSISKVKLKSKIEEIKSVCDGYSSEDLQHIQFDFENNEWELRLSMTRKKQSFKRSLGFHTNPVRVIDGVSKLLNALSSKKASRYDIGNSPYIIMINTDDGFAKEIDFSTALFGISTDFSRKLPIDSSRSFFVVDGKPVNKSVSAVIFCKDFHVFSLSISDLKIWHNPFAVNPLPTNFLPFDEFLFSTQEDHLHRTDVKKGTNAFQLLGVSQENYISARVAS